MANINEAFDSPIKGVEHPRPYTYTTTPLFLPSHDVLPDRLYAINDMGHLEFEDADHKQYHHSKLHVHIGKDVVQRADASGRVNMASSLSTKSYTINGKKVLVDFSRLD